MSRLIRARGLKQVNQNLEHYKQVAPHTGAWIETSASTTSTSATRRASYGRVD